MMSSNGSGTRASIHTWAQTIAAVVQVVTLVYLGIEVWKWRHEEEQSRRFASYELLKEWRQEPLRELQEVVQQMAWEPNPDSPLPPGTLEQLRPLEVFTQQAYACITVEKCDRADLEEAICPVVVDYYRMAAWAGQTGLLAALHLFAKRPMGGMPDLCAARFRNLPKLIGCGFGAALEARKRQASDKALPSKEARVCAFLEGTQ